MRDDTPRSGEIVDGVIAFAAACACSAALGVMIAMCVDLAMRDHPHDHRCPRTEVRLNAIEYELQRRRCEAVEHGALELAERDRR